MRRKDSVSCPLDNSAIIHLAARQKNYTNSFRIVITLKEPVCGETLQKAVIRITRRFPTIIAGIRPGVFQYHVVPCTAPPRIRKEEACLSPMTDEEIRTCAFRVLYRENRIVTEYFHSLTDGYIAFTPKYKRKVIFNQYREDLRDIIKQLCNYKGVEIIEGHIMPAHVHLLLSIPPKYSVSNIMGYLKGKSALMMFDRHANLKYKFGNRHFWAEGFYVSTVGVK